MHRSTAAVIISQRANSLEHYGVKGMKWGVRKRKETAGNRSGSQVDSSSTRGNAVQGSQKSSSKLQTAKKIATGAAIVAGAGLAVYGASALVKNSNGSLPLFVEAAKKKAMNNADDERLRNIIKAGGPNAPGLTILNDVLAKSRQAAVETEKAKFQSAQDTVSGLLKSHSLGKIDTETLAQKFADQMPKNTNMSKETDLGLQELGKKMGLG